MVQALHIFKYLDIHRKNELAFEPAYHNVGDQTDINVKVKATKEIYPDAKEELPPNAPPPRGKAIELRCFVDSDHADDVKTR